MSNGLELRPGEVVLAKLTIKDAKNMSLAEKHAVFAWLASQAADLMSIGHEYSDVVTARYISDRGNSPYRDEVPRLKAG